MFGYAVKHHAKRADVEVQNDASLTPLTLSSKLGRNEIFKAIIELQSMVPAVPIFTLAGGASVLLCRF